MDIVSISMTERDPDSDDVYYPDDDEIDYGQPVARHGLYELGWHNL